MRIVARRRIRLMAMSLIVVVALDGCAGPAKKIERRRPVPRVREMGMVRGGTWRMPDFTDDLSPSSLREAVQRSLEYYARIDPAQPVYFGKDRFRVGDIQRLLQEFLDMIEEHPEGKGMKKAIRQRFRVYRGGGKEGRIRFTGYYEPVLYGSRLPGIDYTVPLYRVPADLITVDLGLFRKDLKGMRIVGRYENGRLVPYYSRHEIDRLGLLQGKGYEIAWVQDPVEAFFLHIQGSGKVILPDGSTIHIHYAASNGRPYRGIANLLVEEGKISAADKSMRAVKEYLKSNPGDQARIMDSNESYVFFEEVPDGPLGSLGVTLTPGRSIAMDPAFYPRGVLAYIQTEAPVLGKDGQLEGWRNLERFVLVQDAGGAIRGPDRADIFWGGDEEAGAVAGWMDRTGRIYFLAPKPH